VGISDLTLTGSLSAERNTGPESVTLDFGNTDPGDDLVIESGAKRFGGSAQLTIAGFIDVSASFGFEQSTSMIDGVETTRIKVAAAGITTFFGTGRGTSSETGFLLSNGQLGAVIDRVQGGETKYALVAQGTASLVGISGLTLSGTMHARMNRLGAAIDTTISTPAGPVALKFDSAADVTQFGGSARLAVGGFVDIAGNFGIEKSGNELLVGVTGVSVFLGVHAGTPGAIGLQVSNGTLGLVMRNGKYALTSSGAVGLVGLDGLNISGTFTVEANKLGTSVNRTIWTPGGSVSVFFANGDEVLKFGGTAVISVAGVFEIRGEVIATKMNSGRVLIDIPEIAVALKINGLQVFEVGGRARFAIGGSDGFQLLDVGVTDVSVFGIDIAAAAGSQPSLTLPPQAPVPAQLTTIVDGIDAGLLNRRQYLDITFQSPGNAPLDVNSILDTDREFSLSGAGVLDAVIDRVEQLEGTTFRYHLKDRNTSNDTDLFGIGGVTVNFLADSWQDTDGTQMSRPPTALPPVMVQQQPLEPSSWGRFRCPVRTSASRISSSGHSSRQQANSLVHASLSRLDLEWTRRHWTSVAPPAV